MGLADLLLKLYHQNTCVCYRLLHTSLEMRRWWLFLIRTLTGLWTSSEDVPEAWSLSPSEPIFTFSWTMPTTHRHKQSVVRNFRSFGLLLQPCFIALAPTRTNSTFLLLYDSLHVPIRGHNVLSFLDFIHLFEKAKVGS